MKIQISNQFIEVKVASNLIETTITYKIQLPIAYVKFFVPILSSNLSNDISTSNLMLSVLLLNRFNKQ